MVVSLGTKRVSAAARGQQSRRTGKQTLAGRLFGCEEAGTMRRDETLSPAKEGRSPGRPGNDKKQTVDCSALNTTGTAKNTLISSSCSSNDLRTLPASLPVHHLLSAILITTTENSEHIIIPTRNIQQTHQGQTSQAPSSNFAPPSRSPNRASSAQLYIAKLQVAEPYEPESHFSYVALPSPSSFPQGERIDGSCVSPAT